LFILLLFFHKNLISKFFLWWIYFWLFCFFLFLFLFFNIIFRFDDNKIIFISHILLLFCFIVLFRLNHCFFNFVFLFVFFYFWILIIRTKFVLFNLWLKLFFFFRIFFLFLLIAILIHIFRPSGCWCSSMLVLHLALYLLILRFFIIFITTKLIILFNFLYQKGTIASGCILSFDLWCRLYLIVKLLILIFLFILWFDRGSLICFYDICDYT